MTVPKWIYYIQYWPNGTHNLWIDRSDSVAELNLMCRVTVRLFTKKNYENIDEKSSIINDRTKSSNIGKLIYIFMYTNLLVPFPPLIY